MMGLQEIIRANEDPAEFRRQRDEASEREQVLDTYSKYDPLTEHKDHGNYWPGKYGPMTRRGNPPEAETKPTVAEILRNMPDMLVSDAKLLRQALVSVMDDLSKKHAQLSILLHRYEEALDNALVEISGGNAYVKQTHAELQKLFQEINRGDVAVAYDIEGKIWSTP